MRNIAKDIMEIKDKFIKYCDNEKKIYKKYGEIISQAFSKGKYRPWSSCTQELERYHVLSETKFIPIEKMRSLFKKIATKGATILIASHNKEDINKLCDKVYRIKDNKLENIEFDKVHIIV